MVIGKGEIMDDNTPVQDERGLYYDMGNGVNKAEALRQDFIFACALIGINFPNPYLKEELENLYEIVEELAELAGAKVL